MSGMRCRRMSCCRWGMGPLGCASILSFPLLPPSYIYSPHPSSFIFRPSFLHTIMTIPSTSNYLCQYRLLTLTSSTSSFNGWGVSMYDALDTLLLMGLHPQFDRVVEHIGRGAHAFGAGLDDSGEGTNVFGMGGKGWWWMEEVGDRSFRLFFHSHSSHHSSFFSYIQLYPPIKQNESI